jgi:hypothetical protein
VTIRGLTMTGGLVTGLYDGGGIYTDGDLTLDSVIVSDNEAGDWGGGIYVSWLGSLQLLDSTVDSNSGGSWSGGISGHFESGERLYISGSTISNNTAPNGAGLMYKGVSASSTGTIVNSTVSGNSGDAAAGMRIGDNGHMTIINSTITDNHATTGQGGGIMRVGLEQRHAAQYDPGWQHGLLGLSRHCVLELRRRHPQQFPQSHRRRWQQWAYEWHEWEHCHRRQRGPRPRAAGRLRRTNEDACAVGRQPGH